MAIDKYIKLGKKRNKISVLKIRIRIGSTVPIPHALPWPFSNGPKSMCEHSLERLNPGVAFEKLGIGIKERDIA